jgi:GDPmannose 4,6-dehydratase
VQILATLHVTARRALITGVTGQDGLFLAELLLDKGYEVFGLVRPESLRTERLAIEVPGVRAVPGDLRDMSSLVRALEHSAPDEVYNLAATSFVGSSWELAELNAETTAMGALRMLEALRLYTDDDMAQVRYYQASSSEVFGSPDESPQTEITRFHPRSPYGVAKVFAHNITVNYRESYGAYSACGILYNHESERRGHEFVTRKITSSVARIKLGLQDHVELGTLDSTRDWGYAGDYVEAMWRILQQEQASDFVIATGISHSIRDLLTTAFGCVGVEDWTPFVRHDKALLRPADGTALVGDAGKAASVLGWRPSVTFPELVARMVEHDLRLEHDQQVH